MRLYSTFRYIILLILSMNCMLVHSQKRFTPGKIVEGNATPYNYDYSLRERFGLPVVKDEVKQSENEKVDAMEHILQKRPHLDSLPRDRWVDYLFLSGSIGTRINAVNAYDKHFDKIAYSQSVNIGRWINTVSGFRVGLHAAIIPSEIHSPARKNYVDASVSADYMFSFSNFINGFDPDRRFNVNGFLGAEVGYAAFTRKNKDFYYGGRGGFQFTYGLSRGMDLLLEIGALIDEDKSNLITNWRKFDPSLYAELGLQYTMIPRSQRSNLSEFEKSSAYSNLFLSLSGGVSSIYDGFNS